VQERRQMLYFWPEAKNRKATLVFDSGYGTEAEPIGNSYVYQLTESVPSDQLQEVIRQLGTPNLTWRLLRG